MPEFNPEKLAVMFGMPRGGSTTMYHILDQHPDCYIPFRKETAYFSFNYHKGEQWFKSLFSDRADDQVAFDISPQYFGDVRSIERIKELAPNAKIILSLRDPVEFIISSFYQTNKFEEKQEFKSFAQGYTVTGQNEVLHFNFSQNYIEKMIRRLAQEFGKTFYSSRRMEKISIRYYI